MIPIIIRSNTGKCKLSPWRCNRYEINVNCSNGKSSFETALCRNDLVCDAFKVKLMLFWNLKQMGIYLLWKFKLEFMLNHFKWFFSLSLSRYLLSFIAKCSNLQCTLYTAQCTQSERFSLWHFCETKNYSCLKWIGCLRTLNTEHIISIERRASSIPQN